MMENITSKFALLICLMILVSCKGNPASKIQGVFEGNKDSLAATFEDKLKSEGALAKRLIDAAIKNSVIEFKIEGDSMKGIIFIAGETTIFESEIIERNDSLVVNNSDFEAYLFPSETGLTYSVVGSNKYIELDKTNRTELSSTTQEAIKIQQKDQINKAEFKKNLGNWQKGNYVDEFEDKTGEGFAFTVIRGTTENSVSTKNNVYVKVAVDNKKLSFQIFNNSLTRKETMPKSEFGKMKLKFPDGIVKSQEVFFFDNGFSEYGDNAILFEYLSTNDGIVKVFVDLKSASRYYSDKYQFSIRQNNLLETLNELENKN